MNWQIKKEKYKRLTNREGKESDLSCNIKVSSVQSLSCVQLFVTPWTAALQASLSITNSQSLLKLMSIESVMPSNHVILCHPHLLPPSIFPSIISLLSKGLSRVFSNTTVQKHQLFSAQLS